MTQHNGKVIIITGGASGIGKETALQLSDQGATIVVADYNEDGAKKLAAEIEAAGGTAGAYKVDVSKGDEIKALIDWTVEKYGTLSGIFNNAGIGLNEAVSGDGPGILSQSH